MKTSRIIQVVLLIAMVAAGIRLAIIYRSRSGAAEVPKKQEVPLNADYYVTPKKLHAYDLKSAAELTTRPAWVREGHRFTYYRYDPKTRRVNFSDAAGRLGPIEKLKIVDVITAKAPEEKAIQVMAVFEKENALFAFPIGVKTGSDYQIYADEILYIEDPRQLYKHWPTEIWQNIERREMKPGMSELQAAFALGMGIPHKEQNGLKVVDYPNAGQPITVTYRNGKAIEVKPGAQG